MTIVQFIIEAESAEAFIEKMELALGPERITEFLEGPTNEWITNRAHERFDHEGDSASGEWGGLSQATVDIREALGYGDGPINERTGQLRRWAVSSGTITEEEGSIGGIWPGDDPVGQLIPKVEHARKGGISDWGNPFPARPVVAFDAEDVTGIALAFARWFATVTSA